MKVPHRYILFFFGMLLTMPLTTVQAQDSPQAVFDQANELLTEGDYYSALNVYKTIEQNGFVSGALFLNMGISAVQIDSMGLAKYYFMRASGYPETLDQAEQALNYVEAQFSRQSATLPKLPWDKAVEWLYEVPGSRFLFLSGFVLVTFGLVLLLLFWFNLARIPDIKKSALPLIATGTFCALLSFYISYVDVRYDTAIVINESIRVFEQPDENASLVGNGYEGYELILDQWKSDEKQGWKYIRLGNGQFGWIKDQGVLTIF